MKTLKKEEPKYREKLCIDCGNPFYCMANHYKRKKRCLPCQQYFERTYMREYQRARRAEQIASGYSCAS